MVWGSSVAQKRSIRRDIKRLQRVKTWQLVVLLILVGFIAATFLRLNNIGMEQRRDAVIAADEAGDKDVIAQRLYDLGRYVSSHMNTDMGKGVYLQHQYSVDTKALLEAASNDNNPNGNIYKKAQDVCRPQFMVYSTAYLQCTLSELDKYPAASTLASNIKLPDVNEYRHIYVSPLWSPDFAGFSVLLFILIVLLIIARLISLAVLRMLLHRHHKSI